jgi:hypothetical protein
MGILAVAVSIACSVGCSSAPPPRQIDLKPCDVSCAGLKPKVLKKSLTGAEIEIPCNVANANSVAVNLESLGLDASINGSSIGMCDPLRPVVIPAGGTSKVSLIYHASLVGGGLGVIQAIGSGEVKIEASGNGRVSSADPGFVGAKDFPVQLK